MTTIVCSKCGSQIWPKMNVSGAVVQRTTHGGFVCDECAESLSLASSGLNALRDEIHATAVEKGWWDQERDPLEIHMLMVSEIAEATESVRNVEPAAFHHDGEVKPEGEAIELIDCMIRIMDYFGYMGWDMEKLLKWKMEYNKTRPSSHVAY